MSKFKIGDEVRYVDGDGTVFTIMEYDKVDHNDKMVWLLDNGLFYSDDELELVEETAATFHEDGKFTIEDSEFKITSKPKEDEVVSDENGVSWYDPKFDKRLAGDLESYQEQVKELDKEVEEVLGNYFEKKKQTSDGGSTSYYQLPDGATELFDLINYKNMNFAIGNIFKACYRIGEKEGNDEAYDLRKIIFMAQQELKRIGEDA